MEITDQTSIDALQQLAPAGCLAQLQAAHIRS